MYNSSDINEEIQQLLETYSKMIISIAYTYVKNMADAEDISQEVFVNLMTHKVNFVDSEHQKAYIIRTTINHCKNHLNSSQFKKTIPLEENLSYMPHEESGLLDVVTKLPTKYHSVIHLYYYENYSIKEIAKILHKHPATVGTLLARGRKLLKKQLEGENYDV